MKIVIIARTRCLQRLCFHRCLSVHGGCLPLVLGGCLLHTPGQTPSWADHTLPSACWDTHPSCRVHAGIHPPAQCMLGCGQRAGGAHPAGMHSCDSIKFGWNQIVESIDRGHLLVFIFWIDVSKPFNGEYCLNFMATKIKILLQVSILVTFHEHFR